MITAQEARALAEASEPEALKLIEPLGPLIEKLAREGKRRLEWDIPGASSDSEFVNPKLPGCWALAAMKLSALGYRLSGVGYVTRDARFGLGASSDDDPRKYRDAVVTISW